jgi:hypothetical protein
VTALSTHIYKKGHHMNRILIATTLAASLFATNLFAADTTQGPLAAGKPAGVQKAQDMDWGITALYVGAGALAIALLAGSFDQSSPAAVNTANVATTTST